MESGFTVLDIYEFIDDAKGFVSIKTLENYFPHTPKKVISDAVLQWLNRNLSDN